MLLLSLCPRSDLLPVFLLLCFLLLLVFLFFTFLVVARADDLSCAVAVSAHDDVLLHVMFHILVVGVLEGAFFSQRGARLGSARSSAMAESSAEAHLAALSARLGPHSTALEVLWRVASMCVCWCRLR